LNIADEVLERLRNGEPADEIRPDYRSSSEVCKGFQMYLTEVPERIEKARSDLAKIERELVEKRELSQGVDALKTEKSALEEDVNNLLRELESLQAGAKELNSRGFNQAIVNRLSQSISLNGSEVWHVLESIDARKRLTEELKTRQSAKERVESETSLLKVKTQKTINNLNSAEKKLANVEAKTNALSVVVDLVESALKAGYTIEDLRALLSYLITKNIGKSSAQSLSHLLQLLEAAKGLEDLRTETSLAEDKLRETQSLEEKTKNQITLAEKTHLEAIERQKAAGIEAINTYAKSIITWQHDLAQDFKIEFDKAKASGADVARLEQQAAQLRTLIASTQALMGLLGSTEQLKTLQPAMIIQLLERIREWIQLRWGNALVSLTFDPTTQEVHLSPFTTYYAKIWSLTDAAIKAIIQQLKNEETQNESSQ
jgi:hypothetical protein